MLLMSLIFVDLVGKLYTLHGERPPQFSISRHGRGSCGATCQITRAGGAISDTSSICIVIFGSIALVSLHARGSSL